MWPVDENGIVRRSITRELGYSDADMTLALRSGELTLLEPGAYVPTDALPRHGAADALYRLRVVAVAATKSLPLSHESAAAIHGLDLLHPDHRRIHFSMSRSGGGRTGASRHFHSGMPDDAVVTVDGVAVSTLARTAIDVSAGKSFEQALAALDSALRIGASLDELTAELERRRIRGGAVVAAALQHADGRSANPGESWSRAQMIEARLPTPDLQVEFRLRDGCLAFADYEWDGLLVGEFDGLRKYGRDLKPGQTVEAAVVAEKLREDALRDHVADVARWTVTELRRGTMVPMLRHRMERIGLCTP